MSLNKLHEQIKEKKDHIAEIVDLRTNLQMTQRSFAKLLGVSTRTVEAWEIGKSNPSPTARKLMQLLRLNPTLVHTLHNVEEERR